MPPLYILSCFKISNTSLLALECSNAVKAYQPHYSNGIFTIYQKYTFNVHQITTSGDKFNTFLARTRTKCTAQNAPKHAISSENSIPLSGERHSSLFRPLPWPGGNGYPLPTPHPNQAFLIHPPSPEFKPDLRHCFPVRTSASEDIFCLYLLLLFGRIACIQCMRCGLLLHCYVSKDVSEHLLAKGTLNWSMAVKIPADMLVTPLTSIDLTASSASF